MAPHSSTLAWKIPWMEEPGRLQSMGSLRVGHDWVTSLWLFTFMQWRRQWQPTPVFLPGESQGQRSLVSFCLWGHTESDMTRRDLAAAAAAILKPFSMYAAAPKSLQLCPTLCDPTDGSPPGSPIPGMNPQARTLEWVAISFSNFHVCRAEQINKLRTYEEQTSFWNFPR